MDEAASFPLPPPSTAHPVTMRPLSTVPAGTTSASLLRPFTPRPPKLAAGGCQGGEAACRDGRCIPRDYLCDGERDCADGSDEDACGGSWGMVRVLGGLYLDFSKALDTVSHGKLLEKLAVHGLSRFTLCWARNWQMARPRARWEMVWLVSGHQMCPPGISIGPRAVQYLY